MTDFKLLPEDFYYDDNGNMVFTSVFLKKRKFCCKSGCRHCPYGFGEEVDSQTPSELINQAFSEELSADDLLDKYSDFNPED